MSKRYSKEQFESDWFVYQASLRVIEIIGEAVKGLPPEVRAMRPEIPWTKIARMRDIVAHHYFGIDNDAISEVVSKQAGLLLDAMTDLLESFPNESGQSGVNRP